MKLIGKGMPKNKEAGEIKVQKETKLSALLDGAGNQGMVVMTQAVDMAMKKAKEHGFGIAGTFNTCTSTGAIGYYADKIARQGLLGFVFAGSPETVAMHGSYQPIFGTNPLAIGVPTSGDPVVLDMATAAMAWFGLVQAKTAGQKIPGDVAYDGEGMLTTDPAKAMEGAIRPFDRSYKGGGLALIVEVVTGPLVAASFAGVGNTAGSWGNLVYVIDPELLVDRDEFARNASRLVEQVKATKKQKDVEEIYVPGERGNKQTKSVMKAGEVEIEENLWSELKKVAK